MIVLEGAVRHNREKRLTLGFELAASATAEEEAHRQQSQWGQHPVPRQPRTRPSHELEAITDRLRPLFPMLHRPHGTSQL